MPTPLVTALIPAFNAEKTLLRAIESVWAQDYEAIEIVAIDDGSRDGTRPLLEGLSDRGVRLVALDQNQGECGAMNAGIEAARGEYIAFLDADDEWLPRKISRQVEMLSMDSSLTFVSTDAIHFRGRERDRYSIYQTSSPAAGPEAWRVLLRYPFVHKSTLMARRDALVKLGGFRVTLKVAGDQDICIRLALAGGVGIIPDILAHIHDTQGSLMKAYKRGTIDYLLPMVVGHLEEQAQRLSIDERNAIMAERYACVGREMYRSGRFLQAIQYFSLAIHHGARPSLFAAFMVQESIPVLWLKRVFGPSRVL